MATSTAVAAPATAQRCAFTLKPASNPNSTRIGSAATSVESHQCPNGSYTCVQVTTHPPGNKNQKLCNAELLQRRGEHKTGHFGARPSLTFGCWDTSSRPQCQALTLGASLERLPRLASRSCRRPARQISDARRHLIRCTLDVYETIQVIGARDALGDTPSPSPRAEPLPSVCGSPAAWLRRRNRCCRAAWPPIELRQAIFADAHLCTARYGGKFRDDRAGPQCARPVIL